MATGGPLLQCVCSAESQGRHCWSDRAHHCRQEPVGAWPHSAHQEVGRGGPAPAAKQVRRCWRHILRHQNMYMYKVMRGGGQKHVYGLACCFTGGWRSCSRQLIVTATAASIWRRLWGWWNTSTSRLTWRRPRKYSRYGFKWCLQCIRLMSGRCWWVTE